MLITQAKDIEGNIIAGAVSNVTGIFNFTTVTGAWTPIFVGCDIQQLMLQPRDIITWKLALVEDGTYFTFRYGACFNTTLVTSSGNLLCYVQPTDQDTTFELICAR